MRLRLIWKLQVAVCFAAFFTAINPSVAATISGQVQQTASPGQPVTDARMTLFTPSLSFFRETRSNTLGAYTFGNVPNGTYQVGCAALRFEYIEQVVQVVGGDLTRSFSIEPELHAGQWGVIGDTSPEVLDATDIAVLLPGGKIFYCHDTDDPILFDPVTGMKSFPSGSNLESGCMNGSLLPDGTVIFAGGQDGDAPGEFVNAVRWVKKYTPASDAWEQLADLQHPLGRWYPGMARLADGSFLVMGGGQCCNAARTDTAERFDLTSETWSYTGSMLNPAEFPPSALLYTGEVLITWSPPQLYNPATGQWRLTGNFNQPNRGWPGHSDHSIVVLDDGRVLAIGVLKGPNNNAVMGEIYDPATETWSLTSNPGLVRLQPEVVQLPDGRVFVGGGETEANPPPLPNSLGIVKWTDLYDPATNSWRRMADLNWFREYHAVTLLVPDGRVVTTGGTRIKFHVGPTSNDIEAFSPPYLFRGVRPEITSLSTTSPSRGSQLLLEVTPATQITSVVLMGMQTTTHWVDGGIPRRLVLPFEQSNSTVTASLPTDPNLLPLGHYMVFAMVDDIPSEAAIVQVIEQGPTIPAVSTSGMVVLVATVLAAGGCLIRRSQRHSAA
ncbi:MAG: hypothetical protein A49_16170 [Methyloceanibacter sp.]|nr:MAG: hypothetical protein A49_16170 [Methyloceanibacter sp.]